MAITRLTSNKTVNRTYPPATTITVQSNRGQGPSPFTHGFFTKTGQFLFYE